MERTVFNKQFANKLKIERFPVEDIVQDIKTGNSVRAVRRWTGYSNDQVREGFYREDRDNFLPRIQDALHSALSSWINTEVGELPPIQILEIARKTGISPEKVTKTLAKYPMRININESQLQTEVIVPEFTHELTVGDSRRYGLSPKRIVKDSRYLSRPPGGGPVQKARIDESRINGIMRRRAMEKTQVAFVHSTELVDVKRTNKPQTSLQEALYSEPKRRQILEVLQWFREVGGNKKKNWITGDEGIFLAKLIKLAQGAPVDFLIWNCFGFKWQQNRSGEYPAAKVIDNLDTAITYYFRERIQQMIEKLSRIGNPHIIILIPTNELLADEVGVWNYVQTKEEREAMIEITRISFDSIVDSIVSPSGINRVSVIRWDDYLLKQKARPQNEYTMQGIEIMRNMPDAETQAIRAAKHASQLFSQFGVKVDPTIEVGYRQLDFFGVYAGEGVASRGNIIGERDIVWINFEENSVKDAEIIGADGNIAIITPATPQEIASYYQWKRKIIAARKEAV